VLSDFIYDGASRCRRTISSNGAVTDDYQVVKRTKEDVTINVSILSGKYLAIERTNSSSFQRE
jgi:hypothetical protein